MNNIPNEFKGEIIDKSLFDNLSLTSNIMQLSDKNVKITDELIINLIVKYFFAYRYPDSVDQKIPLSEIEDIFSIAHYYFYLSRQPDGTSIDVTNNELLESFHFIQNNLYSLAMLGDISATTVIFKDIINRVINKEIFDDNYLGVDLGTGSGVLLLAQFIQALRNDFSNVQNIGFDNETNVIKNASVLSNVMGFGDILYGDTTKNETYENLLGKGFVTHLSNETITTTNVSMGDDNDPFFQNIIAFSGSMSGQVRQGILTFNKLLYFHT